MAAASIVVDLLMKTGSFETDTKRAEKALENFQRKAKAVGSAVGLAFVGAGAAIAASLKLSIDSFDQLSKASQKIGVSTEALSALQYAAKLSGVSFESLQTSLGKLSVQIENFKDGSKSAVDVFTKLKIDPRQFEQTEVLLGEIADRFSRLPDGAQKTALAIELFGKSGKDLIPLLNAGKNGIADLTTEAERLGLVIDTKTAKAAEQFNDNLTRLQGSITGLRNELATNLLGPLVQITEQMTKAIKESGLLKAALLGLGEIGKITLFGSDRARMEQRSDFGIPSEITRLTSQLVGNTKRPGTLSNTEIFRIQKEIEFLAKEKNNLDRLLGRIKNETETIKEENFVTGIPIEKIKASSAATNKYAQEIASLYKSALDAVKPTQSISESLQEQLDAFSELDPAVKNYVQGLIDLKKEQEGQIERQERIADLVAIQIKQNAELNQTLAKLPRGQYQALSDELAIYDRQLKDNQISVSEYAKLQFDALTKTSEKAKETSSFMKDIGATFSSAFEEAIVNGKKFSDVLSQLARDITRLITRRTITDPLMGGIDSLISNFTSTLFNASGNAFNSAGVTAFASGGIVNSPTGFTYGGGKMGVMGEAGPEAILPLTRINGDLGVKAQISAPSIVVNVHEAPGTRADIKQSRDDNGNMSIEVMVEQVESIMGRNIYRGTGLAPALERKYGLNRTSGG